MIALLLALEILAPNEFFARMNGYVACLSDRTPANLSQRPIGERTRIYRLATRQCAGERQAAIDAAIRERDPGTSIEAARTLAIDIIDTLSPTSSIHNR